MTTYKVHSDTVDVHNQTSQLSPKHNENAKSTAFISYIDSFLEIFEEKGEICQMYDHVFISHVPTCIIIPKASSLKKLLNHKYVNIIIVKLIIYSFAIT